MQTQHLLTLLYSTMKDRNQSNDDFIFKMAEAIYEINQIKKSDIKPNPILKILKNIKIILTSFLNKIITKFFKILKKFRSL